ncbi:MAG: SHOCT domain-containing protein [Clostridiaceae bacterium]|nr:SHOCT domain-containing protein [Clostridiaceae bacterium]
MMGYGVGYGVGYGGMFMMLIPIVLVAIIVYAIYKLIGHANNNGHYNNIRGNSALDILNERFARGEITEEEYNQKRDMILKG